MRFTSTVIVAAWIQISINQLSIFIVSTTIFHGFPSSSNRPEPQAVVATGWSDLRAAAGRAARDARQPCHAAE